MEVLERPVRYRQVMLRARSLALFVICGCTAPRGVESSRPPRSEELGECFLLHDLESGETRVLTDVSCAVPTSPASTFKIPHALIGLETGVVDGPNHVRKWNAEAHPDAQWGHEDQTLTSAIRDSVVWYFQEVAVGVGRERMSKYLADFAYGNQKIGGELTEFWLDGSLALSAHDQLEFLRKLAVGELPVSSAHVEALRGILRQPVRELEWRVDEPEQFVGVWESKASLEFKTGTADHGDGNVTWLVGRLVSQHNDVIFVSRVIDEAEPSARSVAVEVALRNLTRLKLLQGKASRVDPPS